MLELVRGYTQILKFSINERQCPGGGSSWKGLSRISEKEGLCGKVGKQWFGKSNSKDGC